MSADNWRECPLCINGKAVALKSLKDKYGKIDQEEYEVLRDKIDKDSEDEDEKCTVREDYELGVDNNGYAYVIYSGACTVCGASWNFRKEDILPEDLDDIELVKKINKVVNKE